MMYRTEIRALKISQKKVLGVAPQISMLDGCLEYTAGRNKE